MISARIIITNTVNFLITILILLNIQSKSLPMILSKGLLNRSKVSYSINFLRFKQKSKLCDNIKNQGKSVKMYENDIIHYTAISFYRFVKINEDDIPNILNEVKSNLLEKNIKGTLLISEEGYNGQFVVPSIQVDEFRTALKLASLETFNDVDINVGQSFDLTQIKFEFPYKKLVVKRKNEVLTDGIEPLDWLDAGHELTPMEWHEQVNNMNFKNQSIVNSNNQQDCIPILIDCRNKYESDMGHFKGAISLDTERFSDTWQSLDKLLENIPKDKQILTYCTGGIRCVKVNAYLKQKMGFKNIGRLKKGIIGYDNWIHHNSGMDEGNNINSLFMGDNFLFDRRRIVAEKELNDN